MAFPFRGIVAARPYPPTGLTTARWATEVPPVEVDLRTLWLTQPGLNIAALFGHTTRDSDRFPHVVAWRDELYVEDGHHRLVRGAVFGGATAATVRLFEIPERGGAGAAGERPEEAGAARTKLWAIGGTVR